jgi:hypothetical protein
MQALRLESPSDVGVSLLRIFIAQCGMQLRRRASHEALLSALPPLRRIVASDARYRQRAPPGCLRGFDSWTRVFVTMSTPSLMIHVCDM